MEILTYDEQNRTVGKDVVGTIVTGGGSPKHSNRVIEVKGGVTKYGTHHPKHGWMNNSADFSGIAPTIDSTIHYWHTLLIEI